MKTMYRWLAACGAALFFAGTAYGASSSDLKLPSSAADYRKLSREASSGPCDRCGVVTAVNPHGTAARAGDDNPIPSVAGTVTGPDTQTGTVPLVGGAARDYRAEMKKGDQQRYSVIVRLDNGTYTTTEVVGNPNLQRGDRVRVGDAHVERIP
jgi:hypothetical protein